MLKGMRTSLAVLLAAATTSYGQSPYGPYSPYAQVPAAPVYVGAPGDPVHASPLMEYVQEPGVAESGGACHTCRPRSWVGGEYLYWTVRGNSVPPLASVGNPADAVPGALGQPGTGLLVNNTINYRWMSGVRAEAGRWFGEAQRFGIEGSGFLFERNPRNLAFTDANGIAAAPNLYAPVNNGAEAATVPLNGLGITQRLRLWGAEANGLVNLLRCERWSVDFLAGGRYVDLEEELALNYNAQAAVALNGNDNFRTRNQFYGGQVGTKVAWNSGKWHVDLVGKVGLGNNHRTTTVGGIQTNAAGAVALPFGVYAQANNIGRITDDTFAVVPEAKVQVGYDLTRNLRATLGYSFLYWNNVARPGNAVDRVIAGPGRPFRQVGETDFWAHGFNGGLEFRW